MSVIITLRFRGDPQKLEDYAAANPDGIRAISDRAKELGLVAHRFYGSDDGWIMVADEWPDAESFQKFFESTQPQIGPMMQAVGVTGEPEVTVWRKLESRDEVGWGV